MLGAVYEPPWTSVLCGPGGESVKGSVGAGWEAVSQQKGPLRGLGKREGNRLIFQRVGQGLKLEA